MRTLCAALEQYKRRCSAYPAALAQLAPPGAGARADCERLGVVTDGALVERLLSPQPSSPQYVWTYLPNESASSGGGRFSHYELRADSLGGDDSRPSFWVSDEGRMTLARGRPASAADQVMR